MFRPQGKRALRSDFSCQSKQAISRASEQSLQFKNPANTNNRSVTLVTKPTVDFCSVKSCPTKEDKQATAIVVGLLLPIRVGAYLITTTTQPMGYLSISAKQASHLTRQTSKATVRSLILLSIASKGRVVLPGKATKLRASPYTHNFCKASVKLCSHSRDFCARSIQLGLRCRPSTCGIQCGIEGLPT